MTRRADKRHHFAQDVLTVSVPVQDDFPGVRSQKLPTCHTRTEPFRAFVEVIVSGDSATAIRLLNASPHLAKERAARGATRQASKENFFDRIKHYINEGDTALHMAAAAK